MLDRKISLNFNSFKSKVYTFAMILELGTRAVHRIAATHTYCWSHMGSCKRWEGRQGLWSRADLGGCVDSRWVEYVNIWLRGCHNGLRRCGKRRERLHGVMCRSDGTVFVRRCGRGRERLCGVMCRSAETVFVMWYKILLAQYRIVWWCHGSISDVLCVIELLWWAGWSCIFLCRLLAGIHLYGMYAVVYIACLHVERN